MRPEQMTKDQLIAEVERSRRKARAHKRSIRDQNRAIERLKWELELSRQANEKLREEMARQTMMAVV